MAKDITALRGVLFDTLEQLRDKQNPMDLERAGTIATVAQTIINSAKVELDYVKQVGGEGTGFLKTAPKQITPARKGDDGADTSINVRTVIQPMPGVTITRNRLT